MTRRTGAWRAWSEATTACDSGNQSSPRLAMPSARAISMMDVHMSRLLLRQMLAEEGEHLAPAVHGLLGPVERPVPIEDAVAGTVVAVELVRLAVLLELGLVLVHLLRARRAVVIAE